MESKMERGLFKTEHFFNDYRKDKLHEGMGKHTEAPGVFPLVVEEKCSVREMLNLVALSCSKEQRNAAEEFIFDLGDLNTLLDEGTVEYRTELMHVRPLNSQIKNAIAVSCFVKVSLPGFPFKGIWIDVKHITISEKTALRCLLPKSQNMAVDGEALDLIRPISSLCKTNAGEILSAYNALMNAASAMYILREIIITDGESND